jgi:hypothetical protein
LRATGPFVYPSCQPELCKLFISSVIYYTSFDFANSTGLLDHAVKIPSAIGAIAVLEKEFSKWSILIAIS